MANEEFEILDALMERLDAIPGLHPVHIPTPDMRDVFAFFMSSQDWNTRWDGGKENIVGDLFLGVHWVQGVGRASAKLVADYASRTGEKSVNQILNGDDLDGAVRSIHVKGVGRYELDMLPGDIAILVRPIHLVIYPLKGE